MAINQINSADFNYATMLATINAAYVRQNTLTLTNYDADTAPQVTAGSIFENNGSLFENTALATPTSYAGISNGTEFYLYYDESGGVFIYASTTPVWSDAKQGWYNGNDRALATMYKDSGGTLYQNKNIYVGRYKERPMQVETKMVEDVVTGITQTAQVTSIDVTGFSFNPTFIQDCRAIVWNDAAATPAEDSQVGIDSWNGRSVAKGVDESTEPSVYITNITMGTAKVTVEIATQNGASGNIYYRLICTAGRAQ